MNRNLVFDLATAGWIGRREEPFSWAAWSGKSHCARPSARHHPTELSRTLSRKPTSLLEELADARSDGKRKEHMELLSTVPLLIIDDLGMRKLRLTAAEELLEIIMRRMNGEYADNQQ